MFGNPGRKLKVVAIVVFIAAIVLTFVLAFEYGIETTTNWRYYGGYYDEKELNAPVFFGILVGGFIFSYVNFLVVYWFGELIENSGIVAKNSKDVPSTCLYIKQGTSESAPTTTDSNFESPSSGEHSPSERLAIEGK